jgi:hypothetical protein
MKTAGHLGFGLFFLAIFWAAVYALDVRLAFCAWRRRVPQDGDLEQ